MGAFGPLGVARGVLRGRAHAPGVPHARPLPESARFKRPQAAPKTAWSITGRRTLGVLCDQGGLWTPVSGSQLDHPAPQASTPSAEPTAASSARVPVSLRSTTCIGAVSKTSPAFAQASRSPVRTTVAPRPARTPREALFFASTYTLPASRLAVKALASWMATLASRATGMRSLTTAPLTRPLGPQW